MWTFELVVSLLLLAANAWFVLFEFALVKLRPSRIDELARQGKRNAKLARKMHDEMNDYLSACQLGITMSSLGIGWLAEPALSKIIAPIIGDDTHHGVAFAIAFLLITVIHIVFGELVPKSVAIQLPEKMLLWSSVPMRVFHGIFYIPLRLLNGLSDLVLKLFRLPTGQHKEEVLSAEELRILLGYAYRQGELSLERSLLLENALDFGGLPARSMMIPLAGVVALDVSKPWAENQAIIQKRRLSRYVLVEGERVLGFVHIKDIVIQDHVVLAAIRRDLLEVAEGEMADVLLRKMQRERTHIALVRGSSGAPLGIVTLEDLLEELVGEIHDEHEVVREWDLADHLVPEAVLLDIESPAYSEVLKKLARAVSKVVPGVNADAVVRAVLSREAQGPTTVGRGVAIPHARIAKLAETKIAIARLKTPLPSRAHDRDPIRFLFLIISAEEVPIEQLRAMSRVARLIRDDFFLARLADAKAASEVLEILCAADVSFGSAADPR